MIRTIEWYLKDKHTVTPHPIKQAVVKYYKRLYNPHILIETGTYMGTMIDATKNSFRQIYTIELDKKLYNRAKNKFNKFKHIKVFWGDSGKVLPKLLENIKEPALFWLDAHFQKGTTKGFKETPITEELNSILNHKIKNHIILIDDAEAFSGKNHYYPSRNFLKRHIAKSHPNLFYDMKYNIIRITPR